jgi:hypothetical protein
MTSSVYSSPLKEQIDWFGNSKGTPTIDISEGDIVLTIEYPDDTIVRTTVICDPADRDDVLEALTAATAAVCGE